MDGTFKGWKKTDRRSRIYSLGNQKLDNNFENKIISKIRSRKKNNFYIISDYGHNLITKKISSTISGSYICLKQISLADFRTQVI